MSSNLVKDLFSNFKSFNTEKYDIRTFIGTESKQLKQICLGFRVDQGKKYTLPFLVDDSLKLQYSIQNLTSAIQNLKDKQVKLADSYFYSKNNHDRFELEMIIGLNILEHFPNLILGRFGSGSCFKINDKWIPTGNVNNFLSPEQMNKYKYNIHDAVFSENEPTNVN